MDYSGLSLPTGAGFNWMYSGEKNEKAKYVLIRANTDDTKKYIEENVNSGHDLIHRDDMFVVLDRHE